MEKKEKFQSPASALMAAAVLGLVGECKDSRSVEAIRKDVADAFDLVNRAFDAFEKGKADGDAEADGPTIQVEKKDGDGQSEDDQKTKIDQELLKSRSEDIDRAFNAYNIYAVVLAKHSGRKVSAKRLKRVAEFISRICLKDIEGLDLGSIKVKISKTHDGEKKLDIIIHSDDSHEI